MAGWASKQDEEEHVLWFATQAGKIICRDRFLYYKIHALNHLLTTRFFFVFFLIKPLIFFFCMLVDYNFFT